MSDTEHTRLYEDAPRFLRQRLMALQEGREKDAKTILDFAQSEFSLLGDTFDVHASEIPDAIWPRWGGVYGVPWYFHQGLVEDIKADLKAFDDKDADEADLDNLRDRLAHDYGIARISLQAGIYKSITDPKRLVLTVLKSYANEPVFRTPASLITWAPGWSEDPLHLNEENLPPWSRNNLWEHPEPHLRPRSRTESGKVRKLPDDVVAACRFWTPEVTE